MPPLIVIIEEVEKSLAGMQGKTVNPDTSGESTRPMDINAWRSILTLFIIGFVAHKEAVRVFLKTVKGAEYCLMQAGQHLVFFYLDNAPDIRPVPERDFKPMNDVSVKMCRSYCSGLYWLPYLVA